MAEVRVVVVDDYEPFRRAASGVVDCLDGFRVVGSVSSAEESLRAVAALAPDLVLMDVNLPGVDGLEATRRIRALDEAPVVLLVSTHDPDDLGEDLLGCGAAGFLAKSTFDADRLLDAWLTAAV
jgi:DNA-binding NarL/FixJ family response regulator